MKSANLALCCLYSLVLVACGALPSDSSKASRTAGVAPLATVTVASSTTAAAWPTSTRPMVNTQPTATATRQAVSTRAEPTPVSWAPSPAVKANLSRDPVTAAEQETHHLLSSQQPMPRNDIALAAAYQGLDVNVPGRPSPSVNAPWSLGTRQQFHIRNLDRNTNSLIEAELRAVGEHAYFWFDIHPSVVTPDAARLENAQLGFDQIYDQIVGYFGREDNPGIDGDARIHIVHASPLALCDVTEATMSSCGTLGVFSAWDLLPATVNRYSNQREMFVMNAAFFDQGDYLPVLAHEFRHMIEANHDINDLDWEVEGSAMLAKDLVGSPGDAIRRANIFLANPDQQLNRWTDGNSTPYYGQGYLLNRYIFDRLGPQTYLKFAQHPAAGLQAIDALAESEGLSMDGHSLWLDWLLALALHNEPGRPDQYALPTGTGPVLMTNISPATLPLETTVSQYAADYYRLAGDSALSFSFTGSRHARLLPVLPVSGERMWLADRANYSQMRLTREFDLRQVSRATLNYQLYHHIERGYDFAYVAISVDGGRTWQGLETSHMRGAEPADNPGDAALTSRFYTGDSQDWLAESLDLTAYAGRTVHIRFEYITDPILTLAGIAIDNISIPEISFDDGAENDAGWIAEGFVRATGYIPQRWDLQLVTWSNGLPQIERLALNPDQSITWSKVDDEAQRPAILIVAASAPVSLEPAYYRLHQP